MSLPKIRTVLNFSLIIVVVELSKNKPYHERTNCTLGAYLCKKLNQSNKELWQKPCNEPEQYI